MYSANPTDPTRHHPLVGSSSDVISLPDTCCISAPQTPSSLTHPTRLIHRCDRCRRGYFVAIFIRYSNRRARSVLFRIILCSSVLNIKGLDAFIYGLVSRIELRRSEVSFLPQGNGQFPEEDCEGAG